MTDIDQIYIDGAFVTPHGRERMALINPTTEEPFARVRLADAEDARRAVAAAVRSQPAMAATGKAERIGMLRSLAAAVRKAGTPMTEAMTQEYGAPAQFAGFSVENTASVFERMAEAVDEYAFERQVGRASVQMLSPGVLAAITPWNSNYGFIATKLAHAIGTGTSLVIKPAEQSALQTQVLTRILHGAGLPEGVFNVVTGTGPEVGAVLTAHPDIASVSFTGSNAGARIVQRSALETMKRLVLELGGKGATILLEDANLATAVPAALRAGLLNSGQACVAGSRILVPQDRLTEVERLARSEVENLRVGNPSDPSITLGPMATKAHWDRVQGWIRIGAAEGARIITGGEGRPDGLDKGYFVNPTVFSDVSNDMRIAREEIFGPVLCLLAYRDEEEAIAIANDTEYGLQNYVFSGSTAHAQEVARRLFSGRVLINGAAHDPSAPFGGFRQSGLGREIGSHGLDSLLEPRAIIGT